jgi:GNAT superfamily N-acetyltransferase
MAEDLRLVRVVMVRPTLEDFPHYALPHPYTIRWYQTGDEVHWLDIKARSDLLHRVDEAYYQQTYGAHAALLPQRQAFLCDATGQPIGTATAWFEPFAQQEYGKINWVLIVPEAQGRGLAKPLLTVIGQRLRELGHPRALLYTLVGRLPAIHLYQQFGFVPYLRNDTDVRAWQHINQHLRQPFQPVQMMDATGEQQ